MRHLTFILEKTTDWTVKNDSLLGWQHLGAALGWIGLSKLSGFVANDDSVVLTGTYNFSSSKAIC